MYSKSLLVILGLALVVAGKEDQKDRRSSIVQNLQEQKSNIEEGVQNAKSNLEENLQNAKKKVEDNVGNVKRSVVDNVQNAKGSIADNVQKAKSSVVDNLQNLSQDTLGQNLSEACNETSATVTSWLMNKWHDCKNVAGQPAAAALWNDLKITYNLNPFAQYGFNSIERTLDNVKNKQSWVPLLDGVSCENKIGDFEFYGTPMTEKEDISVVSLYDRNGIIAGLQAWFLQDDLLRKNPPYKFGESKMFREATLNGKKYFVLTAYFVRPSQICNRGRQTTDLDDEGTGKGLWFQIGNSPREMHSLMEIPVNRTDAIEKGWTKNSCFYAMGQHNFYKVDEWDKAQCTDFFPAFLLFDNSDHLIGFGFIAPGSTASEKFEHPSSTSIKYILDKAPDCIMKQADHGGFSTLHVYFTSTPRLIMCPFW